MTPFSKIGQKFEMYNCIWTITGFERYGKDNIPYFTIQTDKTVYNVFNVWEIDKLVMKQNLLFDEDWLE